MGSEQVITYRPLPGARLNMAHPMARNMALCMLFNEQGSRAMDLSPYQANGRLHGFGSPAKRHIGGLDFVAATPSYVEIPASFTQLDFTSEDFSIVAKVYFTTLPGSHILVCRGANITDGWEVFLSKDYGIWVRGNQGGASQQTYSSAGDLVAKTIYTVGTSRSVASVKVYRNGFELSTTAGTHLDVTTSARSAKIGVLDNKTGSSLDGKMEFLYIYRNRALSEAEHKAIHEQPYSPMGYNLFI